MNLLVVIHSTRLQPSTTAPFTTECRPLTGMQVCKGLLPDEGSEYQEGGGGTIADAVDFLLVNFTEMNKLWVRMQHQGSIRDR